MTNPKTYEQQSNLQPLACKFKRPKYGHNLDIYHKQNRQQDGEKYHHIVSKTVAKRRQEGASMDISTAKLRRKPATERQKKGGKYGRIGGKTVARTGDKEAGKRRQCEHTDSKTAATTVTKQQQKGTSMDMDISPAKL